MDIVPSIAWEMKLNDGHLKRHEFFDGKLNLCVNEIIRKSIFLFIFCSTLLGSLDSNRIKATNQKGLRLVTVLTSEFDRHRQRSLSSPKSLEIDFQRHHAWSRRSPETSISFMAPIPLCCFLAVQLFKQRNFCTKPFVNIPIYLPIVRQLGKFTWIWSKADWNIFQHSSECKSLQYLSFNQFHLLFVYTFFIIS